MAVCQQEDTAVFLEVTEALPQEALLAYAKDFLQQEAYDKIGHDVKSDIRLLAPWGITRIAASFDTALAAYLLNPTGNSYEYDDLARDFLSQVYPSEEEVLGKGRNKRSWES